jgi:uncharacterized phosphosugar-binding protein
MTVDVHPMSATLEYLAAVQEVLSSSTSAAQEQIALAGTLIAQCFTRDGMLYVFGSGHSHIFAEEVFYRAGGSARISPILRPAHMLHEGARRSSELERQPGHAAELLGGYPLRPEKDVLVVVSNSGANALPVEVATVAKAMGLPVIAITSVAYADASTATGERLHTIADIVLDNGCPPGDALIALSEGLPRVGPGSSVVGLALLNALVVDALARQLAEGQSPDIYLSAGMPEAGAHNDRIAARFNGRSPHL